MRAEARAPSLHRTRLNRSPRLPGRSRKPWARPGEGHRGAGFYRECGTCKTLAQFVDRTSLPGQCRDATNGEAEPNLNRARPSRRQRFHRSLIHPFPAKASWPRSWDVGRASSFGELVFERRGKIEQRTPNIQRARKLSGNEWCGRNRCGPERRAPKTQAGNKKARVGMRRGPCALKGRIRRTGSCRERPVGRGRNPMDGRAVRHPLRDSSAWCRAGS